jgi:hypothetical protein
MYGDHHVLEVRRILLSLPGIQAVLASSAFHVVEVSYDPQQIDPAAIREALEAAGYLDDLAIPSEAPSAEAETRYFRHTAAYRQTGRVLGFAQAVQTTGRVLWPCPGMGPIQVIEGD